MLSLPRVLDAAAAEDLCRSLQDRLHAGQPAALDGMEVEQVSTLALQVLAAAARTAQVREMAFTLASPSASLIDAIDRLGLRSVLLPTA